MKRQRIQITLSDAEKVLLKQLHEADGAWSHKEVQDKLTDVRLRELAGHGILAPVVTAIGPLVVLTALGQRLIYRTLACSCSIESQVNRAYFRLALHALGWHLPAENEPVRRLERFDPTGRFREVMTPSGTKLVSAKLTGNGFSRRHIGRVIERFKSNALLHVFDVVLLTPNARKGHRLAERHEAFLKILQVTPLTGISAQNPITRLSRPAPHCEVPSEEPYLAGSAWKSDERYLALPSGVISTLQKSRSERVEDALRSIECDGVRPTSLLARFYGLKAADLSEAHAIRTTMRTSPRRAASECPVTFLTLSRKLAQHDDHRLAHRAGTGCMRHLYDIPPNSEMYKAEFRGLLKLEEPDALYVDENGTEYAFEFDNGSYSMAAVSRKLDTFRDRGISVIWGVSHLERKRLLTKRIGDQLAGEIILAEWWK